MTLPASTSDSTASNPRAAASNCTTTKLTWQGVLTPAHLDFLRREFGSLVVCPGYVSNFGGTTDAWGRILIPAATASFWDCKARLRRWQSQGENERFAWWPDEMRQRKIEAITVNDIIDGLSSTRWQAYRKEYERASAARVARNRRRKTREVAIAAAAKEDDEKAAESLIEMGQPASSGS